MTAFRNTPDEVNREVGEVIAAAGGRGPRPEIESMQAFDAIIAASALALEKAAPHAIYDSRPTPAERYLETGTNEWRMFHSAAARALDRQVSGQVFYEEPQDAVSHIVGDVLTQAEAKRIHMAIENTDPAFEKGLNESQMRLVAYARTDEDVASDFKNMSYGNYAALDGHLQRDISSDLVNGEKIDANMKKEMSSAYDVIMRQQGDLGDLNREVDSRLGDFRDFGTPLFKEVDPAKVARVDAISHGEGRLNDSAEYAVAAHERLFPTKPGGIQGFESRVARARALTEFEGKYVDPAQVAISIEADRIAILDARRQYGSLDGDISERDERVANGDEHHRLEPDAQIGLFQAIRLGDQVPALVAMRLARATIDIETENRENGFVIALAPEQRFDRVITYEGIDASEHDARFKQDLYLPGDKVRINDKLEVSGVDRDSIAMQLGTEPLQIKRTVVVGEERDNALGGVNSMVRSQYEFVGHDGRFPAPSFQHERGDEHVYGVVAMKDEKLWLVPMSEGGPDDPRGDVHRASGAAREITAMEDRDGRGVNALDDFKTEIRSSPAAGEFVFRPEAHGRSFGPVELVAVPWMSGTDAGELKAAEKAIAIETSTAPSLSARGQILAAAASLGR